MIYTFGHSLLTLEQGQKLLDQQGINLLVDVRSHPVSGRSPQWNRGELERTLQGYVWLPDLGGWSEQVMTEISSRERATLLTKGVDIDAYLGGYFDKGHIGRPLKKRPSGVTEEPGRPFWNNTGLWDYQWFMWTRVFQTGIRDLLALASTHTVAIMCAEVLWWKCHRSMVADWLVLREGQQVTHLQPKLTDHTEHAQRRASRYEPELKMEAT